ncbi:MAG: Gfo/Idh/MocA family oxidoreductase [Phycisphaerae bacterium]|nr:Gfo/Idh/MocA family oxidoreductase [Phycisphaerae bacterium]
MSQSTDKQQTIRLGLMGFGYWGPNLLRNFAGSPGAMPVMLADPQPARLAKAKAMYPALETVTDADLLLGNDSIDAVVIATPVSTHFALAKRALECGKHVLLEKPMTATVAEAEELVRLAAERDLRLMVDHTFLYNPAIRTIRELIGSGQLGDVLYYDSTRINLGLFQHDVSVVWDLGPHDFAIMDYLVGKQPTSMTALGSAFGHEQASVAFIVAKFADQTLAHFHLNWMSPTKVRRIIVGGTQKMVVYDMALPEEQVKVYDKGVDFIEREGVHKTLVQYRIGDMYAPQIPGVEPLSLMCREFVDAIREHRAPLTDGQAGLRVVKLLTAAERSLQREGSPVLLM